MKGISNNLLINQPLTIEKPARLIAHTPPPCPSSRLKIDFLPIDSPPLFAGRLAHYLPNWRLLTHDPDILSVIQGYRLELLSSPQQDTPCRALRFSASDSAAIDAEVFNLRSKGALRMVQPIHGQLISSLF